MAAGVPKLNVPSDGGALRGSFMWSDRRGGALKGDKVICHCFGGRIQWKHYTGYPDRPARSFSTGPTCQVLRPGGSGLWE